MSASFWKKLILAAIGTYKFGPQGTDEQIQNVNHSNQSNSSMSTQSSLPLSCTTISNEYSHLKPSLLTAEGPRQAEPGPGDPPSAVLLSSFDPTIVAQWGPSLAVWTDDERIVYHSWRDRQLGHLVILTGKNGLEISQLQFMLVVMVTPDGELKVLKANDKVPVSLEKDAFVLVCNNPKRDVQTLFALQDHLYYYLQGARTAGASLLLHNSRLECMDIIKVGRNAKWAPRMPVIPFSPGDFYPTVDPGLVDQIQIYADLIANKLLGLSVKPAPLSDSVGGLYVFYDQESTIKDFADKVCAANEVADPLMSGRCTPIARTIFAMALTEVYSMYVEKVQLPKSAISTFYILMAYYENWFKKEVLKTCDVGVLKLCAYYFTALVFAVRQEKSNDADFSQNYSDDRFVAGLFVVFNRAAPYYDWICNVSAEIDSKFPLPDNVKPYIDNGKNYTFEVMWPIVQADPELFQRALPAILQRMLSRVPKDLYLYLAWSCLEEQIELVDATIYRRKSIFMAHRPSLKDVAPLEGLFRFVADAAGAPRGIDPSSYLDMCFTSPGQDPRIHLCQMMTTRLVQRPDDQNLLAMISQFPTWLGAYIYDNLKDAGIDGIRISPRGFNPFQDYPAPRHIGWMRDWLRMDWPPVQSLRVTSYIANSPKFSSFTKLSGNCSFQAFNCNSAALVFEGTFEIADPNNIGGSMMFGEAEAYAVQTTDTHLVMVCASHCTTDRYFYLISANTCLLLNANYTKTSWEAAYTVEPGSFILVLDSPAEGPLQIPGKVLKALANCQEPNLRRLVLQGFMENISDGLFFIEAA